LGNKTLQNEIHQNRTSNPNLRIVQMQIQTQIQEQKRNFKALIEQKTLLWLKNQKLH